mgnify:FL=1|tara:strand:+ start:16889 stop:18415 length:1527 start_codon:yes stop_codon:yes gene_type:complete
MGMVKTVVLLIFLCRAMGCADAAKKENPKSVALRAEDAGQASDTELAPADAAPEPFQPLAPKATCPDLRNCGACVSDLRDWMQALENEGHDGVITSYRGLDMVVIASSVGTTALPDTEVVLVAKDLISVGGMQVADSKEIALRAIDEWHIRELHNRLAQDWNHRCRGGKDFGVWTIIVQLDEETPWRVVRDVVSTIEAAGADEVIFAVKKMSRVAPPLGLKPPPDPMQKATLLTMREMEKQFEQREDAMFGLCQPARRALKSASLDRLFIDLLPRAIEACECQADIELLKAWRWQRNDRSELKGMHYTGLRIAFSDEGPKPIVHPADLPWAQASQSLQGINGPAYLEIAGRPLVPGGREVRPVSTQCSQRHADLKLQHLSKPPPGGAFAMLTGGACLWPGGMRGDGVGRAKVHVSNMSVKGDLSPAALRDYLQREMRLRNCSTESSPAKVSFTVTRKGKVKSMNVDSSHREASRCISEALACIVFPVSKRGEKVEVTLDIELARLPAS